MQKASGAHREENPTTSPEPDDIRARFAAIEADGKADAVTDDLLPPVPNMAFERPAPKNAAKGGGGGRVAGMAGGGIVGRIAAASGGQTGDGSGSVENVRGMGQAMTIGTGLVGSIIVGTGLGWLADKYLLHSGTGTPWGLIIGFLIGVASGFVNLIRVANELNRE